MSQDDPAKSGREPGLSILQVIQSVLAASFGVQSGRNQARDFSRGSARTFIIAGLIGTVLFILTVYLVVTLVLSSAGVA